ncbi:MAG: hypothetical protein AB8G11_11090 [Saprospiraceae bacterium]
MTFTKNDKIEMLENALSWIVVMAMLIYGIGKIIQFEGAAEIDKTIPEMTGMELMWAFYGYSKPFVLTLGFLEVMGGILIFIKKTRIIGCLFTSTILINVIMQDIFFGVHLGALKAALLYQIFIIAILWLNRDRLIKSFNILIKREKNIELNRTFIVKSIIAFALFLVIRILEYVLTIKM